MDSIYNLLGGTSYSGEYTEVKMNHKDYRNILPDEIIFKSPLFVDDKQAQYSRTIYTIMDIFGDLGGVTGVIVSGLSWFLLPLADHSFTMQFLRNLYKAKTKDTKLFKKTQYGNSKEQ